MSAPIPTGKKILIIEDQKDIAKLLESRLKAAGYTAITALDGQEGMQAVPKVNPDLIITDLAMPGIPGNTIVRILKASEQYKHIPIIMLSAFVSDSMGAGVEVPADVYMRKPYQAEILLAKIKELLHLSI
ncbi:MAG: response regulator [Candidatus Omnitrophica bacterium]|nr:response regulator [Candidatus Omnitrophota bacterium]